MSKSDQIQVRIDPNTKAAAEAVFAKLGIKPSEAVRMFYHQVSINQSIPFELKIPNAGTKAAFKDVETGRNLERHRTLKSLKKSSLTGEEALKIATEAVNADRQKSRH